MKICTDISGLRETLFPLNFLESICFSPYICLFVFTIHLASRIILRTVGNGAQSLQILLSSLLDMHIQVNVSIHISTYLPIIYFNICNLSSHNTNRIISKFLCLWFNVHLFLLIRKVVHVIKSLSFQSCLNALAYKCPFKYLILYSLASHGKCGLLEQQLWCNVNCLYPKLGCLGSDLSYNSDSSYLLMQNLGNISDVQTLGSLPPCGQLSCPLRGRGLPITGCCRHLVSESPASGSLSLWFSNKIKIK